MAERSRSGLIRGCGDDVRTRPGCKCRCGAEALGCDAQVRLCHSSAGNSASAGPGSRGNGTGTRSGDGAKCTGVDDRCGACSVGTHTHVAARWRDAHIRAQPANRIRYNPDVSVGNDRLRPVGFGGAGLPVPSNLGLAPQGGLSASAAGEAFRLSVGSGQPFATIGFGHGSARLSAKDKQTIKSVSQQAMEAGRFVRIVGHASSRTRDLDPVTHQVVNFDESS